MEGVTVLPWQTSESYSDHFLSSAASTTHFLALEKGNSLEEQERRPLHLFVAFVCDFFRLFACLPELLMPSDVEGR